MPGRRRRSGSLSSDSESTSSGSGRSKKRAEDIYKLLGKAGLVCADPYVDFADIIEWGRKYREADWDPDQEPSADSIRRQPNQSAQDAVDEAKRRHQNTCSKRKRYYEAWKALLSLRPSLPEEIDAEAIDTPKRDQIAYRMNVGRSEARAHQVKCVRDNIHRIFAYAGTIPQHYEDRGFNHELTGELLAPPSFKYRKFACVRRVLANTASPQDFHAVRSKNLFDPDHLNLEARVPSFLLKDCIDDTKLAVEGIWRILRWLLISPEAAKVENGETVRITKRSLAHRSKCNVRRINHAALVWATVLARNGLSSDRQCEQDADVFAYRQFYEELTAVFQRDNFKPIADAACSYYTRVVITECLGLEESTSRGRGVKRARLGDAASMDLLFEDDSGEDDEELPGSE